VAVARAADEAAEILVKDLTIKKALPAAGYRHDVPPGRQHEGQNHSGMKTKLVDHIPAPFSERQ